MDIALIVVAFAFGFVATRARLPALVGYLAAGFVLYSIGFETNQAIETVSRVGVYLLLFSIGLKLRVSFLARPEVWGTATIGVAVMDPSWQVSCWRLERSAFRWFQVSILGVRR